VRDFVAFHSPLIFFPPVPYTARSAFFAHLLFFILHSSVNFPQF
jgi:hypothetical protein